ncbi:MAG: cytochrome d ubiquinol oxidase subunit II [Verrucomicrobia bacterium]|nr:cytochrome d ubiquinol oxidase subunit II [Verrucomicrobiota bacterium]
MITLWYAILAFMLTTYIVLDGRNFGVGILHWIVARNQNERRQVIAAIGPLWSWHEVWLVATGGVMLMAFPRLMSASFSGCYLALFLILWCVLLRGISIEVGGHLSDPLWQEFWDAVFVFSNLLLAVLFGAALGNIARGVPLTSQGTFYLPFFTNFGIRGSVGLLDWYTVPVALFCVLILTAHGANYLAMKTEGAVHERSVRLARRLWLATIPAFVIITVLTWFVRPQLLQGMAVRPVSWLTLVVSAVSIYALVSGLRHERERLALLGSSFLLFGLLMTGAAALFPVVLYSTTDNSLQLTAADCAAPAFSLAIAIAWWIPALILAFAYLYIIQRHYGGKASVSKDSQELY